jgi:hypothetical protein
MSHSIKRREFISLVGGAAVKYLAHNPSQNAGSAWLIPPHSGTRQGKPENIGSLRDLPV